MKISEEALHNCTYPELAAATSTLSDLHQQLKDRVHAVIEEGVSIYEEEHGLGSWMDSEQDERMEILTQILQDFPYEGA